MTTREMREKAETLKADIEQQLFDYYTDTGACLDVSVHTMVPKVSGGGEPQYSVSFKMWFE